MKLLYYKVNNRKKNRGKNPGVKLEKILYFSFLAVFFVLIVSQAAMLDGSVRSFLTVESKLLGTAMGVEEYLYKEGEIELGLENSSIGSSIKVLVNGEQKAVFDKKQIKLKVLDGDVLELDTSEISQKITIRIIKKSENIANDCEGRLYTMNPGIKRLFKVKIK